MWLYAAGIGQSLRHWGHQPCQSNSITHFDLGTGRVMILHVEWSPEYRYMFAYIIIQTRMMLCKHISTSIPTHKHILTYVHILNILSSSHPPNKKNVSEFGDRPQTYNVLARSACLHAESCLMLWIKNWKNDILHIKNHKHIQTWLRPRISSNRVPSKPGDPQIWCFGTSFLPSKLQWLILNGWCLIVSTGWGPQDSVFFLRLVAL